MKVLVLNSALIESLLDLDGLRGVMKQAMQSLSVGEARNFPRHVEAVPEGALGFMAAAHFGDQLLGYKAVSVFKRNSEKNLNPHQGLVALLDPETGFLRALLDGAAITALRTATVSAAATDLLATESSRRLALIGNGRQAFEHARAILKIRPIQRIAIWGRSPEKSEKLVQNLRPLFDGEIETMGSPIDAAKSADIVVTATNSPAPLISSANLKTGCHLNAIGASRPGFREVDFQTRPALRIYLDSRAACELEAEEIVSSLERGSLSSSDIAGEIGEAFSGRVEGRRNDSEITVFKSVGLGIQDLGAAHFFYRLAMATCKGEFIEL